MSGLWAVCRIEAISELGCRSGWIRVAVRAVAIVVAGLIAERVHTFVHPANAALGLAAVLMYVSMVSMLEPHTDPVLPVGRGVRAVGQALGRWVPAVCILSAVLALANLAQIVVSPWLAALASEGAGWARPLLALIAGGQLFVHPGGVIEVLPLSVASWGMLAAGVSLALPVAVARALPRHELGRGGLSQTRNARVFGWPLLVGACAPAVMAWGPWWPPLFALLGTAAVLAAGLGPEARKSDADPADGMLARWASRDAVQLGAARPYASGLAALRHDIWEPLRLALMLVPAYLATYTVVFAVVSGVSVEALGESLEMAAIVAAMVTPFGMAVRPMGLLVYTLPGRGQLADAIDVLPIGRPRFVGVTAAAGALSAAIGVVTIAATRSVATLLVGGPPHFNVSLWSPVVLALLCTAAMWALFIRSNTGSRAVWAAQLFAGGFWLLGPMAVSVPLVLLSSAAPVPFALRGGR